jgi:hypothetical protein
MNKGNENRKVPLPPSPLLPSFSQLSFDFEENEFGKPQGDSDDDELYLSRTQQLMCLYTFRSIEASVISMIFTWGVIWIVSYSKHQPGIKYLMLSFLWGGIVVAFTERWRSLRVRLLRNIYMLPIREILQSMSIAFASILFISFLFS